MQSLLSVDAVARRLGVAPQRIHEFVREGRLACVQISPKLRMFTVEQVQRFIEENTLRVDNRPQRRLRSEPKTSQTKGGVKPSGGLARAQLKEEMRSW